MNPNPNSPIAQSINVNDPAELEHFIRSIASAFSSTSLSRAFISAIDSLQPPYPNPSFNVPRIHRHIGPGISDAASHGAELVQAGNFSACAVWETTSYTGVPFSETQLNVGPVREGWRLAVTRMKELYIGTRTVDGKTVLKPFYHLGFLVRNPNVPVVKGAVRAVVEPWLERARAEGVPVWLEATYEHAVAVYEHFGFRVMEVVIVGEGACRSDGWPGIEGEEKPGVKAWGMIWDGHLRDKS